MEFSIQKRLNMQTLILSGFVFLLAYLALVPLLMLLFSSIRSAPVGQKDAFFTIKNYIEAYFDPDFLPLLKNSFIFGSRRLSGYVYFGNDLGMDLRTHQHAV